MREGHLENIFFERRCSQNVYLRAPPRSLEKVQVALILFHVSAIRNNCFFLTHALFSVASRYPSFSPYPLAFPFCLHQYPFSIAERLEQLYSSG